eukprot:GEZU01013597.1.p2 GENE.GEZU01013597.1~~GEZU01013597.1.p2  ORF type:complete len:114 (-),score=11.93 GEZU01013597.1:61-402(-)
MYGGLLFLFEFDDYNVFVFLNERRSLSFFRLDLLFDNFVSHLLALLLFRCGSWACSTTATCCDDLHGVLVGHEMRGNYEECRASLLASKLDLVLDSTRTPSFGCVVCVCVGKK